MKNRKCNRYPYCMSTNDNNIYSRAPNPNLILRYEFLNDKSNQARGCTSVCLSWPPVPYPCTSCFSENMTGWVQTSTHSDSGKTQSAKDVCCVRDSCQDNGKWRSNSKQCRKTKTTIKYLCKLPTTKGLDTVRTSGGCRVIALVFFLDKITARYQGMCIGICITYVRERTRERAQTWVRARARERTRERENESVRERENENEHTRERELERERESERTRTITRVSASAREKRPNKSKK